MKISILAALLLFGCFSVCSADPSATVQYLMHEPVTLFDWGILRLYEYLDEYTAHYLKTNSVQDIYSTVSYDEHKNIILISLVVTRQGEAQNETPASVRTDSREICQRVTRTLRREFLTDRDRYARRSLGIYRFFSHIGFTGKGEPVNAFEEIEKITVIQVSVYSDRDPGRMILQSESPLMGKEIRFKDVK